MAFTMCTGDVADTSWDSGAECFLHMAPALAVWILWYRKAFTTLPDTTTPLRPAYAYIDVYISISMRTHQCSGVLKRGFPPSLVP